MGLYHQVWTGILYNLFNINLFACASCVGWTDEVKNGMLSVYKVDFFGHCFNKCKVSDIYMNIVVMA